MIEIRLEAAGKRFNQQWIFRDWTAQLRSGNSYAILGSNGSGKSTRLKVIYGFAPLSTGSRRFLVNGNQVADTEQYQYLSFCSPYLELYEELTLGEMVKFHFSMKPMSAAFKGLDFFDLIQLGAAKSRAVKYLSSGMKQRLRLGLALCTDTPVTLLDEPTSNLDHEGIKWYRNLVQDSLTPDRLLVIASNRQSNEYDFCNEILELDLFIPA